MGGVRLGGIAIVVSCSPPFSAYDVATGSANVWRACSGDAPGLATQITDFSDGRTVVEEVFNPVLSPDGTQILFEVFNNFNHFEIWVVSSTPGSTATQLLTGGGSNDHYYHPSWGIDSDTFVYIKGTENHQGGPFTIFEDTISAPGSPTTLKTLASGTFRYLARPRYNFDGTRIAYMRYAGGASSEFRCMDADGTNDTLIANISDYSFLNPSSFAWANTQNLLAWSDGANDMWLADDTGGGLVDLNASGVAAGLPGTISQLAWPTNDSFVVYSAVLGVEPGLSSMIRTELDGSGTTELNVLHGPSTSNMMRAPVLFNGRLWFIEFEAGDDQVVGSTLLDGTGYRVDLDVSLGGPDMDPFGVGNGWYFN